MQSSDTGLTPTIHVMSRGGAKHGPRVKVSNVAGRFSSSDNFTITAENEPRVVGNCKLKKEHVEDIIDWIRLNKDHLHKVWNEGDSMSATTMLMGFKKLS